MKKINHCLCMLVLALFAIACSGESKNTPEAVAEKFMISMCNGDIDTFFSVLNLPAELKQTDMLAGFKGKMAMILEQAKQESASKGGLDKVTIENQTYNEDKTSVKLDLTALFKNGEKNTQNITLTKIDDKWLVNLN